ncbi:hypothetical protein HQ346_12820 [Rhodococcus sp. BP-252]|uniref:hypothetical protein n=1 Tax=unclassified Rhodococcus (in: high G+C Gram-positive bacteria) TaxID=192944 RepID=UPI001C9BBB03|nr:MULTISPECIES: hypothetical protein [unclassified Rhodococcus (in: high G+C Gram-positive bacteria)]MBY6411711.1 hypothetical protein [Rhodococcus sp. BP-320]MBY6417304.1 hypothetical protein [Rhodococcus sp. BP-321]MBY6421911.1 hypothetical protein [Rhodococcus sp. BP-324]MBY6427328.1 hypothetical protein [Rhodococcus sp. BP-323]MBY6432529.1 hypothetical protein [Rhodococcus sp. BP-322]
MAMFSVRKPRPFAWMSEPAFENIVRLRGHSYLVKLKTGAVLVWRFEEDDGWEASLHVHLTNAESQKVFDTERTEGMIEAVRKNLKDPWALLAVSDSTGDHVRRFRVPRWGNEHEFAEELRIAAASTPEYQANILFSIQAEMDSLKKQISEIVSARDALIAERDKERERLRQRLERVKLDNREESDFVKNAESLTQARVAAAV